MSSTNKIYDANIHKATAAVAAKVAGWLGGPVEAKFPSLHGTKNQLHFQIYDRGTGPGRNLVCGHATVTFDGDICGAAEIVSVKDSPVS